MLLTLQVVVFVTIMLGQLQVLQLLGVIKLRYLHLGIAVLVILRHTVVVQMVSKFMLDVLKLELNWVLFG